MFNSFVCVCVSFCFLVLHQFQKLIFEVKDDGWFFKYWNDNSFMLSTKWNCWENFMRKSNNNLNVIQWMLRLKCNQFISVYFFLSSAHWHQHEHPKNTIQNQMIRSVPFQKKKKENNNWKKLSSQIEETLVEYQIHIAFLNSNNNSNNAKEHHWWKQNKQRIFSTHYFSINISNNEVHDND